MPHLSEAQTKAQQIIKWLQPHCSRIEVAGSVRRLKDEVKDIEIVCQPHLVQADLFGQQVPIPLDLSHLGEVIKDGQRYKQVELEEGYNLDLFLVWPPAQWGVIMTIRTGPWQFSKRMVTQRNMGGLLPSFAKVADGGVYVEGKLMKMTEEMDFFNFCDVKWIEPWDRA